MKKVIIKQLFDLSAIHIKQRIFREVIQIQLFFNNYLGITIRLFGFGFTLSIRVFNPENRYPFEWIIKELKKKI